MVRSIAERASLGKEQSSKRSRTSRPQQRAACVHTAPRVPVSGRFQPHSSTAAVIVVYPMLIFHALLQLPGARHCTRSRLPRHLRGTGPPGRISPALLLRPQDGSDHGCCHSSRLRPTAAITASLEARTVRRGADALRVFSIDPVENLVVPRFLTLMLAAALFDVYAEHISENLLRAPGDHHQPHAIGFVLGKTSSTTPRPPTYWGSVFMTTMFGTDHHDHLLLQGHDRLPADRPRASAAPSTRAIRPDRVRRRVPRGYM